jgi:hypothetical protein
VSQSGGLVVAEVEAIAVPAEAGPDGAGDGRGVKVEERPAEGPGDGVGGAEGRGTPAPRDAPSRGGKGKR